jgi:hypothetical protein
MLKNEQVNRHDAHLAYVAKDKVSGKHMPCSPDHGDSSSQTFSELVVFENAAILPRFILSIEVPHGFPSKKPKT